MQNKKRIAALIICIVFVVTIALSYGFIITHSEHECVGESCKICLELSTAVNTFNRLKNIVPFVLVIGIALLLMLTASLKLYYTEADIDIKSTPVLLKVKLRN
ncbi:hypothetical protein V6615_14925 [Oscillospiraceae bacterium PP1C4]